MAAMKIMKAVAFFAEVARASTSNDVKPHQDLLSWLAESTEHAEPLLSGSDTLTSAKVKYDILSLMEEESRVAAFHAQPDESSEHAELSSKSLEESITHNLFGGIAAMSKFMSESATSADRFTPTWAAATPAEAEQTYRLAEAWGMPTKTRMWPSWDAMEKFLHEKAEEVSGRFVLDQPREEMSKHVRVLEMQTVPWTSVLLSCHLWGPTENVCHMPVRNQVFRLAVVEFDDGHRNTLLFTEHNMEPGCLQKCRLMHHIIETALMVDSGLPPLFDTVRHSMVSV